jgi:hypothetical protein
MRTFILALAIIAGFAVPVATAADNTMCIRQCSSDGTYCTIYCI